MRTWWPARVFLASWVALSAAAFAASPDAELDRVRSLLRDGKNSEAEIAARKLLREAEETGTDSLALASILDQLAISLRRSGKSSDPDSREVCDRALRIKRTGEAPDSSLAFSLQNLGGLLLFAGDFQGAKPVLDEALELREHALGPDHPDVATSLLWVGNLKQRSGSLADSEPLLRRALEIRRAALPKGDPAIAECASGLGAVLFNLGDIAAAIPLYEEAIEINRERLGPWHPALGEAHHNLGATLLDAGDYEESRTHLETALRIRTRSHGAAHPLTASTLTVLASALEATGEYREARARYEEALRIRRETLGERNPETAWTMMKLGLLHLDQRRLTEAERLLREAHDVQRETLGAEHYDLAWTLVGLARIAGIRGDFGAASELFQRALRIQDATYGESGPEVALTLGAYASELARTGHEREAADAALRGAILGREHLRLTAQGLAERQALAYASARAYGLDVALALSAGDSDAVSPEKVWDALIRTRTLVLDEVIARERMGKLAAGDTLLSRMSLQLDRARQRLSVLLVSGAGDQPVTDHRAKLQRARQDLELAERSLAAVSTASRRAQEQDRIGFQEVVASLPAKSCLVSFVRFRDPNDRPEYMAFVLRHSKEVRGIPLGPAGTIDSLVGRWVSTFSRAANFAHRMPQAEEERCRLEGQRLLERVWTPIEREVSGADRVYVVPDGAIYRMSFAALPAPHGAYLAEKGPGIHYLSSERDLVRSREPTKAVGFLALGNPSFGSRNVTTTGASGASDCGNLDRITFEPLPESEREVREISTIWPVGDETLVLTGSEASESAFKSKAPGRRAIHLATHGFFLDGSCRPAGTGTRGIGGTSKQSPSQAAGTPAGRKTSKALLQLSGLALSGANRRGGPGNRGEDGILTAEEISSMDLSSLQWVVLSACDTGLGRIQAWEGVLGLRRAFQAAGARTTVMSLWAVEDRSARAWMEGFYGSLLSDGNDIASSVREASLKVLRDQRAQGRSTHPFYWAGFVATGLDS